jgi:hypothetical protein
MARLSAALDDLIENQRAVDLQCIATPLTKRTYTELVASEISHDEGGPLSQSPPSCDRPSARSRKFPYKHEPSCRVLHSYVKSLSMRGSQNLEIGAWCERKIVNHHSLDQTLLR